ncbi:hypothetical protein A3206_03955 [Candidatus Methanomassiliicoccus intestinalis]|jgi:restriction system mrr homolog|uniref:Mrr restriction system protein-like protein n=1 Tax=Methanomassiliicoccus intestinalis (strain Issoire-Mx1) TaxID=1295009 RepID=R9T6Y6_METII|nr:restriction endonuclease [Candidatus Methanomassiliicoccus intestinalis]AGN25431.1 Mrr restriction system protein-like protein [Candidatus Methanomassiliicoccus intestinalis Issoire-Mx1]TQS81753.1 MAG: hypothetical protein A3206_03955 [Candidatus Methanomassiliicoccus intestinalis]
MKTVYLNTLSGGNFEVLCQDIFLQYYKVPVENMPLVNDKGRDLIIHSPDGDIFVECKHHPHNPIGRPVVQKLHSAMITENVSKGIIVTTGYFSKDAVNHVNINNLPIDLIDRDRLKEIAYGVGYSLLLSESDDKSGSMQYIPPESGEIFKDHLSSFISRTLLSYPNSISSELAIEEKKSVLVPFYKVEYDVNATFSTSVGLIHTEKCSDTLYLRQQDLSLCDSSFSQCFPASSFKSYDPVADMTCVDQSGPAPTMNELTKTAYEYIINKHTRSVSYDGRNNQSYTKTCAPSKKDILIKDVTHVYIPYSDIEFLLHDRKRKMSLAENHTSSFFVLNENFLNCEICNSKISSGMLCNDCGAVVHVSKKKSHGLKCSFCDKTVCISCSQYFKKYLFFKKPVCSACAIENKLKTKRYKIS